MNTTELVSSGVLLTAAFEMAQLLADHIGEPVTLDSFKAVTGNNTPAHVTMMILPGTVASGPNGRTFYPAGPASYQMSCKSVELMELKEKPSIPVVYRGMEHGPKDGGP